ncbi:hypothetical protein N0V94_004124 [Neodidymelliopsis sp. IMI 364377]|nr:hypothetical protein N0V94_004124 [Neodidymelliopsis sp. IMI 364377]
MASNDDTAPRSIRPATPTAASRDHHENAEAIELGFVAIHGINDDIVVLYDDNEFCIFDLNRADKAAALEAANNFSAKDGHRRSWVQHDEYVMEVGEFEISAAIWLSKMGVRELALAMEYPRSVPDVALSLEQEWMFGTHEEEEQTAVREFAVDVRL